jgi:hypothetical protein
MLPRYLPVPATLRPNALRQEHQQKELPQKTSLIIILDFTKEETIVEQNAE